MTYRLGLDLGTNSIGWSVIGLNHNGFPKILQDAGVRIFTDGRDPQKGTSLAASRTEKRGFRRRRDRFTYRRKDLLERLTALGLLPESAAEQKALSSDNPYQLRAEALDRPLTPHELGRALVHLNQRRGFKSNRKQLKADDDKAAQEDIEKLKEKFSASNARTLGEFLYDNVKNGKATRARNGEGLYPLRMHYENEFDTIQTAQAAHQQLTQQDWADIKKIIFFQRDLAPQPRGRCQLMYKENKERADAALPSAEMFVALQLLNNLGWRDKGSAAPCAMLKDHPGKWQKLWQKLQGQKSAPTFKTAAKTLGLDYDNIEFNLEKDNIRTKLEALQSSALLRKSEHFGQAWQNLTLTEKDDIVHTLLNTADIDALKNIAKTAFLPRSLTQHDPTPIGG